MRSASGGAALWRTNRPPQLHAKAAAGRHALALLATLVLCQPSPAAAQSAPDVLTRYAFHLNAASIFTDDERFTWEAAFGGDLDVIDYGVGRLAFLAEYQVILGREQRAFDPNQGLYRLDFFSSWRRGPTEVAAVFHHVSRHLSDRAKQVPIDWNSLGARIHHTRTFGGARIRASASLAKVVKRSYVDYLWETAGGVHAQYGLTPRWTLIGSLDTNVIRVERAGAQRDRLIGGRAEGGIRARGPGAAVEVFAALERRIDADPLDRRTRHWALVGFRLVSPE